jgi:hypothetical protein
MATVCMVCNNGTAGSGVFYAVNAETIKWEPTEEAPLLYLYHCVPYQAKGKIH